MADAPKLKLLFVCVENSNRSQMSQVWSGFGLSVGIVIVGALVLVTGIYLPGKPWEPQPTQPTSSPTRIENRIYLLLNHPPPQAINPPLLPQSSPSNTSKAFAKILGGDKVEAYSAGSKPSGVVNPKGK